MNDNKVFCVAPWTHMHVEPDGNVQLCCASNWKHDHNRSLGNLNDNTPEEIWNNSQYKQIRKNMLAGRAMPEYCSPCYIREQGGINQTERQRLNKEFSSGYERSTHTNQDGSYDLLELEYLDIRFNNLCNLKCRTCGPDWSSSWANEMGKQQVLRYNDNWRKLIPYLGKLKKVYFAGGEPLMTPEHYDFLEHLSQVNTDIELLYTSNFTRLSLGNRSVLDQWRKFRLVSAVASIDHVGEHAKYVRTGSDYELIKQNIHTVATSGYDNIHTAVTCVLSLYNITKIGTIVERLHTDGVIKNMDQIVFNILVNPDYQMATVMPDMSVISAVDNIHHGINYCKQNNMDPQKLESILQWFQNNHKYDKDKFTRFVEYNKKLDAIRDTDFEQMYPELAL